MKYIKEFKLIKETGEWPRGVDLQHVLNNPDDDDEASMWITLLYDLVNMVKNGLNNPSIFEIIDIRGFDLYTGPYAIVKIFGKRYKIWNNFEDELTIADFPINNMDKDLTTLDYSEGGFRGHADEIAGLLNEIEEYGSIELYLDTKKYNL